MTDSVPSKEDYLNGLRKRLQGPGTDSYKKMISEEIAIIQHISEKTFVKYYKTLEGLFNHE